MTPTPLPRASLNPNDYFSKQPHDVKNLILSFCSLQEHFRLAATSRTWQRILDESQSCSRFFPHLSNSSLRKIIPLVLSNLSEGKFKKINCLPIKEKLIAVKWEKELLYGITKEGKIYCWNALTGAYIPNARTDSYSWIPLKECSAPPTNRTILHENLTLNHKTHTWSVVSIRILEQATPNLHVVTRRRAMSFYPSVSKIEYLFQLFVLRKSKGSFIVKMELSAKPIVNGVRIVLYSKMNGLFIFDLTGESPESIGQKIFNSLKCSRV